MTTRRWLSLVVLLSVAALCLPAVASADSEPGAVVSVEPLRRDIWVPGAVDAYRITHWTDGPTLSSGAVYLPPGEPPPGGWPVVAWAHGTVGLGGQCAYSVRGPGLPERDFPFLATWLRQGYAIVASDYAGLGTPGPARYLNGIDEAHSVVDMVRASATVLPELSTKWVVVGQSQGAGAALTVARYATEFGGPGLDSRGAVATGVPAYIENLVAPLGPGLPPVSLGESVNAYLLFILSGVRATYPALGIDGILTAEGKALVDVADSACYDDLAARVADVAVGSLFVKPLRSIPDIDRILQGYMGIPESGYDRPFFVGQGLTDTDVPPPTTIALAARLAANGQPLTFKVYPTDHDGTLLASLSDSVPFVQRLFG